MRLPPYFRYLPSRLRPLLNPLTLTAGLVTAIMGVLIWEYSQEPGGAWNSAAIEDFGDPIPAPETTPAEPDSVEALLADLDAEMARLESGDSGLEGLDSPTLDSALDSSSVDGQFSTDSLARYIDQYQFRSAAPLQQQPSQSPGVSNQPVIPAADSRSFNFGSSLDQLPGSTPGALSQAISAQPSATPATPAPALPTQPGIVPGQLSGSSRRFIQTTPTMSPPAGTTGYVPPVSIPQAVPGQSSTPLGSSPFPLPGPIDTSNFDGTTAPAAESVMPLPVGSSGPRPANAWDSFFTDN